MCLVSFFSLRVSGIGTKLNWPTLCSEIGIGFCLLRNTGIDLRRLQGGLPFRRMTDNFSFFSVTENWAPVHETGRIYSLETSHRFSSYVLLTLGRLVDLESHLDRPFEICCRIVLFFMCYNYGSVSRKMYHFEIVRNKFISILCIKVII